MHTILRLNALSPDDVAVQLYYGPLDAHGEIVNPVIFEMLNPAKAGEGVWRFSGTATFCRSGRHGYSVRILPAHELLTHLFEMRLIRWPAAEVVVAS